MFGVRTSFTTSFWSARSEFVPFEEPAEDENFQEEESEPVMEDKKGVIDRRMVIKTKNKEQQEKAVPGHRLLKKMYQQQQLEESLVRVIKTLVIK